MVLTEVGMGRIILAIALCAGMAGTAVADRIVVTSSDHSEGAQSADDRRANAETIKAVLDKWVSSESLATDHQIDVGVVKLTVEPSDADVCVVAELRIAISDRNGKMVSVVSGTSTVTVSGRMSRSENLPMLRRDALVAATRAMLPKLRTHLHVTPSASVQSWSLVHLLDEWFARLSPQS
jgi:hypothetical protein